jgi:hypothetical protein
MGDTDIERTPEKLRNPELARPVPRGRVVPGADGGSTNAASNGHWIHDTVGPRNYVAPDAPDASLPAPEDLVAAIEEQMAAVTGLDTTRITIAIEADMVLLAGFVDSAEARRRAGACAVAVAAPRQVENRIKLAGTSG